jgi:hypothetical protein
LQYDNSKEPEEPNTTSGILQAQLQHCLRAT